MKPLVPTTHSFAHIIVVVIICATLFFASLFSGFLFNKLGMEAYSLEALFTDNGSDMCVGEQWDDFCKAFPFQYESPLNKVAGDFIKAQECEYAALENEDLKGLDAARKMYAAVSRDLLKIDYLDNKHIVLQAVYEERARLFSEYFDNYLQKQAYLLTKLRYPILENVGKLYAKKRLQNAGSIASLRVVSVDGWENLSDEQQKNLLEMAYDLQKSGLTDAARSILQAGAYLELHQASPSYEFTARLQKPVRSFDLDSASEKLATFRPLFKTARIIGMYVLSALTFLIMPFLLLLRQWRGLKISVCLFYVSLIAFLLLYIQAENEFIAYSDAVLNHKNDFHDVCIPHADKIVSNREILAAIAPDITLQNGDKLNFREGTEGQRKDLLRLLYVEETYHPDMLGRTHTFYSSSPLLFQVLPLGEKAVFTVKIYTRGDKLLKTFQWNTEKATLTPVTMQKDTKI